MKKYIFGLLSAICLIGAGCTKFEDYTPADLGEGPVVEATLTQDALDAFTAKVIPAEGTVYYSYLLTTEALPKVDPMVLLQTDYESTINVVGLEKAILVSYEEEQSVTLNLTGQPLATTYYLYAVAANHQGLCGEVAVAQLELPDNEAPHLVKLPEGNQYKATNKGRTVSVEFNEPVLRGEGAITYAVAGEDGVSYYAEGTIETVVINGNVAAITLPETVQFTENATSYVFLDFAAAAFVDEAGNVSEAMKGGVDDEGLVAAPWWEYKNVPNVPGTKEAMEGTYGFIFVPYNFSAGQPGSQEDMQAFDTEFSLKYANSIDTVMVSNFYFKDVNIEAGLYEGGLSIADFQPMTVTGMQDQTGQQFNVLVLFAGLENEEGEQFDKVKFEKTDLGDGEFAWMADRWCGIYLLDYDVLQAGGTWEDCNLGWYDLWTPSFFIEGSAFAGASVHSTSKYTIQSSRALRLGEKQNLQSKLKTFSKEIRF